MAVAKWEFTDSIPIFDKIAVNPAKIEEAIANKIHIIGPFFHKFLYLLCMINNKNNQEIVYQYLILENKKRLDKIRIAPI